MTTGRLGLLAFGGGLPAAVAAADPDAHVLAFEGIATGAPAARVAATHRFETLGAVFRDLREAGVTRVAMAGALSRPRLDPAAFDDVMVDVAPRLGAAMALGDDALLRVVIDLFETRGFAVVGAADVAPELAAPAGLLAGPAPGTAAEADILRGEAILAALGPLDLGQAVAVAGGLCLGIETLQGTDALLRFVAATDPQVRPPVAGVLVKRPKPGQDLRVDMPAIGPETVRGAAAAGLSGIAVAARGVLLLDRPALEAAARDAGIFVLGRGQSCGSS